MKMASRWLRNGEREEGEDEEWIEIWGSEAGKMEVNQIWKELNMVINLAVQKEVEYVNKKWIVKWLTWLSNRTKIKLIGWARHQYFYKGELGIVI